MNRKSYQLNTNHCPKDMWGVFAISGAYARTLAGLSLADID